MMDLLIICFQKKNHVKLHDNSQVRDAENRLQHVDDELRDADRLDSETDDTIVRNFIPTSFPLRSENHVIDDAMPLVSHLLQYPVLVL